MALIDLAKWFGKTWYVLTAYVPRKLPTTKEEWDQFQNVLVEAYGVPDEAHVWYAVAGQVTSHDPRRLRRPWGEIANVAKRISINNLAAVYRNHAAHILNERAATAMKKAAEAELAAKVNDNDTQSTIEQKADAVQDPTAGSA